MTGNASLNEGLCSANPDIIELQYRYWTPEGNKKNYLQYITQVKVAVNKL